MRRQSTSLNAAGGIIVALGVIFLVTWLFSSQPVFFQSLPANVKYAELILGVVFLAALLLLGLAWGMRLCIRWFPVSPGYELTYTQADLLNFQRHYGISALVYLAFASLMGFGFYYLLAFFANLVWQFLPAEYILPANPAYWVLPAIFAAVFLAGLPTWYFYRWLLKERFPRFLSFHNRQFGFDQCKAGRVIIKYGLLFTLSLSMAGLSLFHQIDHQGITTGSFLNFYKDHHPFSEVVELQETLVIDPEDTDRVIDRSFIVTFSDSSQWQSISFGSRPVPAVYTQAFEYAARQSARPLKKVIQTGRP